MHRPPCTCRWPDVRGVGGWAWAWDLAPPRWGEGACVAVCRSGEHISATSRAGLHPSRVCRRVSFGEHISATSPRRIYETCGKAACRSASASAVAKRDDTRWPRCQGGWAKWLPTRLQLPAPPMRRRRSDATKPPKFRRRSSTMHQQHLAPRDGRLAPTRGCTLHGRVQHSTSATTRLPHPQRPPGCGNRPAPAWLWSAEPCVV